VGTLYLVATPLGNLEDITLRALRILKEVALIATEDTRTTGRLLNHFDIQCPMLSYYEHNKLTRLDQITAALATGDVALVSEAGTPVLSDPGYELVRTAIEQGLDVVPIPGPSAITTALSASGLPPDRFLFLGFLPRKSGQRRRLLATVQTEPATLIFFESPHRVQAALADMTDILGGARAIVVCRELTKLHEEFWRGKLADAVREWEQRPPRGEFTLVVAGAEPGSAWDEGQVISALRELAIAGVRTKKAIRQVTDQSGWSRREVYALALQIKNSEGWPPK
jgi:16S rRNA (cytidine1402-2'-O)-methyltransferase